MRQVRNGGGNTQGFTLIELAIAISVLMIGMVSVLSATSQMHGLRKQNRQRATVQNACRSIAERIHARSHELSSNTATWSEELVETFGEDGAFGNEFDVRTLGNLVGRDADGLITVITDETATDAELGVRIGMPRDLDGDGAADNSDVTVGAKILPVLLEVRWRSPSGTGIYRHAFYVMGY